MTQEEIPMKTIDDVNSISQTDVTSRKGQKLPQYLASVAVNITSFTYGVSLGWPSSAIPQLSAVNNPIGIEPITVEDGSWLGGLICVGALAALPIYSYTAERFGRKISGYLVGIPFIAGWILTYIATSVRTLFVARFVLGLGSGGTLLITPLYVAEIAEDTVRGTLGSFLLLFINFGMLVAYILGAYVSFHAFAVLGTIFPVLYLVAFFWLPETPVYLITKQREADALVSLKWFRGNDGQLVDNELQILTRTINETKENSKASMKDLVSTRTSRLGLIIGLILCVNQQFCGIYAINSYVGNIFQSSGSDLSPEMATIIVGGIQLVGSFASSVLMDRAGRRILIITSNVAMAVSLTSIGVYFYLKITGGNIGGLDWLPVTSLSIYVLSFALGMGPIPFVMISEILSPQIRGLGTWVCITVLWLLAFLVGKFFNTLSDAVGIHVCFWFFAVCCTFGTVFHVLVLPETKNKSLEVILQKLSGETKRSARRYENDHTSS